MVVLLLTLSLSSADDDDDGVAVVGVCGRLSLWPCYRSGFRPQISSSDTDRHETRVDDGYTYLSIRSAFTGT